MTSRSAHTPEVSDRATTASTCVCTELATDGIDAAPRDRITMPNDGLARPAARQIGQLGGSGSRRAVTAYTEGSSKAREPPA